MTSRIRAAAVAIVLGLGLTAGAVRAHHGASDYQVDREVTITGTIAAWRWVNPHVRFVVTVAGLDGRIEEWDCEGPPLTWATQQRWSASTFAVGERVTLVMYPLKRAGRGGLVKRVERASGETLRVSRPWLD